MDKQAQALHVATHNVTACSINEAQIWLPYCIYYLYFLSMHLCILSRFQLWFNLNTMQEFTMITFNIRSQPNYCFSTRTMRVHVAMSSYNSMLFKWNIAQNILISCRCDNTFIPKVCAVTGGGRWGGVVTIARGWVDDVSGGMVVRDGGDG